MLSQDHMQSPLKALLNTFWMHYKTYTMATRYRSNDREDISANQDSPPLYLAPPEHPMPEGDNELSDENCEETDTCHPLPELSKQFLQLKDQFQSLKSTTHQSTPTAELRQLTDKLQHLTMSFQPHPVPQSSEEPVHKTMQAYADILHTTQRESNLNMSMLQDMPTFDGQDSLKLRDWLIDIETAADILTESCTCLDEAKSHGLTFMLICKATQTGKCWDWKFGMQISILILHTLWRYNRRTMKFLLPIPITSKQPLSNVLLTMTLQQSKFLWRDFEMHPPSQLKYMEGPSNFDWCHQTGWKTQCSTPTNSHTDTHHGQYDVLQW